MTSTYCLHSEIGTFNHVCGEPSTHYTLSRSLPVIRVMHCAKHAPRDAFRLPAEDLTPEGIQLVIPGAERRPLPTTKQGELF